MRIETELIFYPGADAPHVYVRAWTLCCFHSLTRTQTFRRALTASVDSCAEIECPFSGVTRSGRVWRRVPGVMLEVFSVQRRCLLFPVAIVSTVCACSSLNCQQSALVPCYTVNSLPLFLVTLFLVTLSTVCLCSSLHSQQFGLVLRYIVNCALVPRYIVNSLPLFLVKLSTVWPCSSLHC